MGIVGGEPRCCKAFYGNGTTSLRSGAHTYVESKVAWRKAGSSSVGATVTG